MSAELEGAQVIGVDGGATSARACRAERTPAGLRALAASPTRVHPLAPGFVPVLREAADSALGLREHQLARAWSASLAECVEDVLAPDDDAPLVLGVAMPGLKTADGRGLAWLCHGPRAPRFLDELEARLAPRVERWGAPAQGLFSDAVAAAEGERVADGGALAGVANAWYLGGGTGVGEAMLVAGVTRALDDPELELPRAWELEAPAGASYEARLSMASLVERCGGFPEARPDDPRVREVLVEAAQDLAELLALRVRAWRERGLGELERVVVGQRLGALLADPRAALLAEELARALEARELPSHGWVVAAAGEERPALGAASLALRALGAADG